jgi:hypothetical protein
MNKELVSDAGWKTQLSEISAGAYRIILRDHAGQVRYSAMGGDPDLLEQEAHEWFSTAIKPSKSTGP